MLQVIEPGLLSTVQDAGRPYFVHLGVPESGASDRRSLAVANLLLGNDPGAAALEMTLIGPTVRAVRDGVLAIAGADLGGRIVETGEPVGPGTSMAIRAGTTIAFPGRPSGGARAYLAVPGGLDVPEVLGSRSTCLAGGFGGMDGRPVRAGDVLSGRGGATAAAGGATWPASGLARAGDPVVLRLVPAGLGSAGLKALLEAEWTVRPESDRMGVRLEGPRVPGGSGEVRSFGAVWGAVQLPAGGEPVVLGPDHQTTGGYPVPGVIATADRPALAQLGPGDRCRFVAIDPAGAREMLLADRDHLATELGVFREGGRWDELWQRAGS